ncbi:hypothetical protein F7725_022633 [Dissostichus mawsoni]|uniref:Haloacid dehalogenase-like hydrolase domain-containing 5 n=1 Tax=Dissostichus mawsoni TaxID=36200 RepID=A0A7J5Z2P3_DISMA|nr:hypothetical protein F7725_022633 [Dissostichus mawsoni]
MCKGAGSFGLLFDIDGVLVRGRTPIPAAKQCFKNLVDRHGKYKVPVVFVTNAGNSMRQAKAEHLSHLLEVEVTKDQVMLSHSPLRMFTDIHKMRVLVSGQGPIEEVAHKSEQKAQRQAVILFGEPIRWETNLQLIVDVLLSNGNPDNVWNTARYPHIPILACNMDLLWMAEAKSPRFGHGMFLVCLESMYKKVTGFDLKYEALIGKPSVVTYNYAELLIREQAKRLGWTTPVKRLYAIGDNLMSDIYGANLYDHYLQASQRTKAQMQAKSGGGGSETVEEALKMTSAELGGASGVYRTEGDLPEGCSSILVCTGVYSREEGLPSDPAPAVKDQPTFHGHRDFRFDPSLTEPTFLVEDVKEAVELVFQQEGWPLE